MTYELKRRDFLKLAAAPAALGLLNLAGCNGGSGGPALPAGTDVHAIVDEILKASKVPALSGALINSGTIKTATLGIREIGKNDKVTDRDLFTIGSIQKSVTGTLAGRLVEKGRIRYDTTIVELFPEFASIMNAQYRTVTLEQLLNHRAGLIPHQSDDDRAIIGGYPYSGTLREQRVKYARNVLKLAPSGALGDFLYSNAGFIIAGAMMERATNTDYFTLLQREVFAPLGSRVYQGSPRDNGPNQPRGHVEIATAPFAQGFTLDGLDHLFEPTGDECISTPEFARYAQMHLRGLLGQKTIVSAATMTKLHTPIPVPIPSLPDFRIGYSFGWAERTYKGVRTIMHDGSDGTFFSQLIIQPTRNLASYAVTNIGPGVNGESDQWFSYKAVTDVATRLLDLPNFIWDEAFNGATPSNSKYGKNSRKSLFRLR